VLGSWNASLLNRIDEDKICEHISILGSDEFQGRKPNTIGEEKSIGYIKEQFQEIGLEPGNNGSWFQEVPLADIITKSPKTIELVKGEKKITLDYKKEFVTRSSLNQKSIEINNSEFVFVGFGINAPEISWNDYKNINVEDKIVLAIVQYPGFFSDDSLNWQVDIGANLYSQAFYKRNEAAKRGAKGIFLIFEDQGPGRLNWDGIVRTADQSKMELINTSGTPVCEFTGFLTPEAARKLFSYSGLENYDYIAEASRDEFVSFDLNIKTSFILENDFKEIKSNNVLGLIHGSKRPNEVVIYTAHWDHEGINKPVNGDSIYNGAVDNATGVASIIEIARAFKLIDIVPERSVLFIATTAEEMGLLGAIHYASNPVFKLDKTIAAINMDAHFPYGRTKTVVGVVYGRSTLDVYIDDAVKLQERSIIKNPEPETDVFFRSDHYPFVEVGIPSIFAVGLGDPIDLEENEWMDKMVGYGAKYHQPTDEFDDNFLCSGIAQDAEMDFIIGWKLSNTSEVPEWNSDQPFYKLRFVDDK
jgi:hypothetical protein